ncbi:PAS domain-containing protein, partial [Calidithermus terrae]|uniref:PAS domain-containing protein n=1 Tax=Calidithermus terrae TaxID=1408545 RepID=UPI000E652D86
VAAWVGTFTDVHERKVQEERLSFLAAASERLSLSRDPRQTLAEVARLAVPVLGDWCAVYLPGSGGTLEPLVVHPADEARVELVQRMLRRYPIRRDAPQGTGAAYRTGKPQLLPVITDALLEARVADPERLAVLKGLELRSGMSLPMVWGGEVLGVIDVASSDPHRRYGEADVALGEEFARRAAAALANARLFAQERRGRQRAEVLRRLAQALAVTLEPAGVCEVAMREASGVLGAVYGGLYLLEGEALRAVSWTERGSALRERYREVPLVAGVPLADSARDGRPRWFGSAADYARQYPHLEAQIRALGTEASVSLPLAADGRVLGCLVFAFADVREWDSEERDFLLTLSGLVAQALERARLYEGLRASEERLRLALQSGRMGAWDWDTLTGEQRWSPEQEALFGLGPGTLHHHVNDFFRLVHPDDRERIAANAERAAAAGEEFVEEEYRIVRPDGQVRWIASRSRFYRDDAGRVVRMSGVNMDVTGRKQAEEALRESEERFRQLAETIPQLAWMADASGHIFWYNQRWYDYTGTTLEEMEGWGWQKVHDPGLLPEVLRRWRASLQSGEPFDMTFPLRGADGVFRPFLTRVMPFRDASGRVTRWFGTNTDVTERQRAEEALRQSEERYRRLAEAQKRFVADAAHELRAPLTAIQGNLELLLHFRDMGEPDYTEALTDAAREAQRLSRLVNDMLALARGDAGLRLRLGPVRLDEVLREAFATARSLSNSHRLELGPLPPLTVPGDRDRLKQLALILLENALKYTPAGGAVRLGLERSGGWAELRVVDTGVGIAPEHLPHVFERFYRADPSRSRDSGGTGLGLSIAKWVVEQHGGEIRLQSEPGKGTTAVVRLPVGEGIGGALP